MRVLSLPCLSYRQPFNPQQPALHFAEGCCTQSTLFNIPSQKTTRRPANIPLRALSSAAGQSTSHSRPLLGSQSDDEKQGRRSSLSRSSSPGSEFDSWSDTGDLAEQLGEEDPLSIRLQETLDSQGLGGSLRRGSRPKRVHYQENYDAESKAYHPGIVKEDIEIPETGPRYISRAEHILAAIMSGGERQMHGLTGKPLV